MIEELKWKKFSVLNDGFICLVDIMGSDDSVVQAARVSYGEGTKQVSSDRDLIRYLMRHRHTTPFEMVELKFLIRCPMDCWRQWIRHRTASINEYSTRYSEAIDSQQTTDENQWRAQSIANKQGSQLDGLHWPEDTKYDPRHGINEFSSVGDYLSTEENNLIVYARNVYEQRLRCGVAREQARKDLPLSTYTEAYWKINLHNLFHFLSLRMDKHAQQEIREYATIIGEQIIAPLFPICWEAFSDYRLNGMFLSRMDIEAIQSFMKTLASNQPQETDFIYSQNKREKEETINKLKRLGFIN